MSILLDWVENKVELGDYLFVMFKVVKCYLINKELFIKDEYKVLWKIVGNVKFLVFLKSLWVEVMNLCYDIFILGY